MCAGGPPHFLLVFWAFLYNVFSEQWIAWGQPTACPALSPDLNPFRLLSLGHLKPILYATEVSAIQHLQQWIQNSLEMIQMRPGIFQRVRWSLFRHATSYIQAEGWHVGHLFSNLERRPWFINHASEGPYLKIHFFRVLWCGFTLYRFGHSFLFIKSISSLSKWLHC